MRCSKKRATYGSWTVEEDLSQRIYEDRTDKHKSLSHFFHPFIMAKLTVWNPWIPLDVRIHLIRLILLVSVTVCDFFDPLFETIHCRQLCLSYPPGHERKTQKS